MKKSGQKKKVFVGLSGGVDSAVSAGLLLKAGYDVTGVFIKVWQPDWIECNWKEERRDAMRVSAHLGIPFITLDLVNEYKQDVIDYMIREYSLGRTPNPDVMCNRYVKFGGFWKWAKEQGADYVATGHYARVEEERVRGLENRELGIREIESNIERKVEVDAIEYRLLKGVDQNKDQSYFLWTLNQKDLPHILFPVGHLQKTDVRHLSRKFGLPNATKKDSQGLCFIGKVDIKEFLAHYIKTEKGNVLNEKGEVVGEHNGSIFFTKGERHGFKLFEKTPNDAPYYVIDKDVEQNTITVSNKVGGLLPSGEKMVTISSVNWVGGKLPDFDPSQTDVFPLQARSRYRQELSDIRIVSANISEVTLEFAKSQDILSAGQSLVIYDGERCVGGGVIE